MQRKFKKAAFKKEIQENKVHLISLREIEKNVQTNNKIGYVHF